MADVLTSAVTMERPMRSRDVAEFLGISKRKVEMMVKAGEFPPPDAKAGVIGLWRPATVRAWLGEGQARA